jgi:mannose-6-phosphate isomerase-like protein (cupin superfamily)
VKRFADATEHFPAPGVSVKRLLDDKMDSAVLITRTDIQPGRATPEERSSTDQRALVEGSGTAVLNGVRQSVVPGDMVMIPRGTKVQFEADAGVALRLWNVASTEAPMTRSAGVLSEDNSKEFFVGEGVLILERANSAADPGVGFDRCRTPAGMTTALHKLKIDERYLITRGAGVVEFDGQTQAVSAGDVVQFPKGTAQRITAGKGGCDFYCVTTPRFLVEDYDKHLEDARVDPALYDGLAGDLAAVQAKIKSS